MKRLTPGATIFPDKTVFRSVGHDEISPWMGLAVIASEDQKFPDHWGFDVAAIESVLDNSDSRMRGASTLSQQTAKNLFLWDGRSWVRKGLEAGLTAGIEPIKGSGLISIHYAISIANCSSFGLGPSKPEARHFRQASS